MSKKMNEMNDIIETAYTVADYSHGGGYYDKSYEPDNNKRNAYSSIPYHRDHINTNTNNNNIFLKYNQTSKTNMDSVSNTTDNVDINKIVLNDDNFPSLGGKNEHNINKSNKVENKLDFKKMVEKKPIIAITHPILSDQISSTNNRFKNNQYSLYNEIKERSEKIAQNKMIDEISSDDEYMTDSVF
jgi:hypothetical protein